MYYEIYADSLLLLHFFMNLYLLVLVNQLLYKVASGRRLLLGALLGTLCSAGPILLFAWYRVGGCVGFLLSVGVMCKYTFRPVDRRQFLQVVEKMVLITLVLGGIFRVFLKNGGGWRNIFPGVVGVLIIAPFVYWLTSRLLIRERERQWECKVVLHNDNGKIEINALIDTGNSLIEPISGSPVSVAEPEILLNMLGGSWPEGYRIVPYHSVGKQHGIMKAYLVKRLWVEVEGSYKECLNVYVGESNEFFKAGSKYQMILNPEILKGE